MKFLINPTPLEWNGARRTRGPSASTEVAVLALATAAGAVVGSLVGRSSRSAGVGAGLGFGVAVALIATAEDDA